MSKSKILQLYNRLKEFHSPSSDKKGFFPTREIFYNAIFLQKPDKYPEKGQSAAIYHSVSFINDLSTEIQKWYEAKEPLSFDKKNISDACRWFYLFITDIKSDPQIVDVPDFLILNQSIEINDSGKCSEADYLQSFFALNYPSLNVHGAPTCQDKSNKTGIISGTRPIERGWKKAFVPERINEADNPLYTRTMTYAYTTPLAWILQFYSVFTQKDIVKNETPQCALYDQNYIEFFSLSPESLHRLNQTLADILSPREWSDLDLNPNKGNGIKTFMDLANVILSVILAQVDSEYKLTVSEIKKWKKKYMRKEKIFLPDEQRDYNENIAIYDFSSIDYFNCLVRNAPTNIFAAQALGELYYNGSSYNISGAEYRLSRDPIIALKYFFMCFTENYIHPPAAWNIAVIIRKYLTVAEKDADIRTELMLSYLELCKDYSPALLEQAYIYWRRGDKLFLQNQKPVFPKDQKKRAEILHNYSRFFQFAYESYKKGWFYSGNAMALFLTDPDYTKLLPQLPIIQELQLTAEGLYKYSAGLNNPWSMVKLARLYMNDGKTAKDTEKAKEAKELLEKAHNLHYGVASYYLAEFFYDKGSKYYMQLISFSANSGYKPAKEKWLKITMLNY